MKKESLNMQLNNRRIIVNNDFDGFLCAWLLKTLYGCKVVGFSNSKDKLWLIDGETLNDDELYVDMFAVQHDSIDQHILPREFERTLSPNQERKIFTFDKYTRKYPFSTFFYLLAITAADGKDINPFVPPSSIGPDYKKWDIIMRADDSQMNYHKYNRNSLDWEEYLRTISGNNEHIVRIFDFIKSRKESEVEGWKHEMDAFFKEKYGFNKEEIPDIETERARVFMKRFGIEFGEVTSVIEMEHKRCTIKTKAEFEEFLAKYGNAVFSFAFVYSPTNSNKLNFSYTLLKR